jgi:hypothetical protein
MGGPPGQVDYFISYTSSDRAWAEWIAWQLEAAGSTTVLQAWDFAPGSDFVHQMQQTTQQADRTIAVLSAAYFGSAFGEAEWRVAFGRDPTGESGVLVPVRVEDCDPPGLLSTLVYIDLVGLNEAAAQERLVAGLREGERPGRPATAPAFPGLAATTEMAGLRPAPVFPGVGPAISNLPSRNPMFISRGELLTGLREQLASEAPVGVLAQVLYGLGGVGKTQLALEYAHRYAADYDVVWLLRAEDPVAAAQDYAALADALDLPSAEQPDLEAIRAMVHEWLAIHDRWLLVLDNAEDDRVLADLLPYPLHGHVLVTSRNPVWRARAQPMEVTVFAAEEAVRFLRERARRPEDPAAREVAKALGYLPLALEQAGAYVDRVGLTLAAFLERLRGAEAQVLERGAAADQRSVANVWELSLGQVQKDSAAATVVLNLLAFLGPEDLPRHLLIGNAAADEPFDVLGDLPIDEFALDDAVEVLRRYSLVRVQEDALSMHRLVQAVVRARLADQGQQGVGRWWSAAVVFLSSRFPDNCSDPPVRSDCARLLPHALALLRHTVSLGFKVEEIHGWLWPRIDGLLGVEVERPSIRLIDGTPQSDRLLVVPSGSRFGYGTSWQLTGEFANLFAGQVDYHLDYYAEPLGEGDEIALGSIHRWTVPNRIAYGVKEADGSRETQVIVPANALPTGIYRLVTSIWLGEVLPFIGFQEGPIIEIE